MLCREFTRNMRGKKVNSVGALLLIILLFGVLFAYLVGREDESIVDTLEYTPQTIDDLKQLNKTLYGTSSEDSL